jgi:alanine racemase
MKNAWTELDLDCLGRNIASLQGALQARSRIIFVVKANAYGHGMLPVAMHAWRRGVRWFAVAHMDEAVLLREHLPAAEIIILGRIERADAADAAARRLLPVLVDADHARDLAEAMTSQRRPLRCHAKVDTGMGRLGFAWESAGTALPAAARRRGLHVEGLCSHFAASGDRDRHFALTQFDRFQAVSAACREAGMPPLFHHVSNSSAVLRDAAWHMDGVRPGLLLYGYLEAADDEDAAGLFPCPPPAGIAVAAAPCLQWKTRVLQVKHVPAGYSVSYGCTHRTREATWLATLDAGYSDGYLRALSGKSSALLCGRRCPVAGRVTMNMIIVDSGPLGDVQPGDEAVLLGRQGAASIWANELASLCQTIPYEILTSIRTDDRRTHGGAGAE